MLPARRPLVSGSQAAAGATEKAAVATEGWMVLRPLESGRLRGLGDAAAAVSPLALITQKIDGLQKSTNLQKLYLYCNRISRIKNQEALPILNVLCLNNNQIKNIEHLHPLQNLQEVNVAGNLIEKIGSGSGKVITAKVFLGCSAPACAMNPIYQVNYSKANSVFRPWKFLETDVSPSGNELLKRERSTKRLILSDLQDEVLNMELTVKVRPQIACLNEKTLIFSVAKANISQGVLTRQDWARTHTGEQNGGLSQEYFDANHNHVMTLEGIRGLSKLQFFNLSWNQLKKSREDINILHKHTPNLPWHKAGLKLSQRTTKYQYEKQIARREPLLVITVLNLDDQLFKISNLEKLEDLRWASFSYNNLTQMEGTESCNLKELTLDENCISTLDGTSILFLPLSSNQVSCKEALTQLRYTITICVVLQQALGSTELVLADQLRNVCSVNLQNNNLMSFSGLIFLPNARVLCLNYNHIESILPGKKLPNQVTNRQQLYMVASRGYGQQGFAKGRKLWHHTRLLYWFGDAEFGEKLDLIMQSSEDFHLDYNGFTNTAQLQFSRLKNLKLLFLQNSVG
ncbi:LOW QUALITY PROTEIN: leucine-rich repeat-containing protein 9 [Podargus strigoides]